MDADIEAKQMVIKIESGSVSCAGPDLRGQAVG